MTKSSSLRDYAVAFVESLPSGKNAVKELDDIRRIFGDIPSLRAFVGDSSIASEERHEAMKLAAPDLTDETRNLVLLLASHRVLKHIDRIRELAVKESTKLTGRMTASVKSVVPLTSGETNELKRVLKQKRGSEIEFENVIDPAIQGGLHIQINDWVFDATIRGNIRRLIKHVTV